MSIAITPVPEPAFRRFELVREEDVSGVSGTGVVAHGVQFPGGSVVLRWDSGNVPASLTMHVDIAAVIAIHGHEGRTTVEWLDDPDGASPTDVAFQEVITSALGDHTKRVLREVRELAVNWKKSEALGDAPRVRCYRAAGERLLQILDQPFPDGQS